MIFFFYVVFIIIYLFINHISGKINHCQIVVSCKLFLKILFGYFT